MKNLLLILLAAAVFLPMAAQPEEPARPIRTEDLESTDSLRRSLDSTSSAAIADSSGSPTTAIRKKSVPTAMLLSAFIPGGGQFYTDHYIKGVLIAGTEITLGYLTVEEHLKMLDAGNGPLADTLRNRRNTFAFFTGVVLFYAVADSYVDAHMYRFKDSQRLSLGPTSQGLGLAFRYRF